MDFILLGIVIEVREEQYSKASDPILVILLGIVTEVTYGRQAMIVLFFINNPSTSLSAILAPQ